MKRLVLCLLLAGCSSGVPAGLAPPPSAHPTSVITTPPPATSPSIASPSAVLQSTTTAPPSPDSGVEQVQRRRETSEPLDRPVVRWNDPGTEGDKAEVAWKGQILPDTQIGSQPAKPQR